MPLSEDEQRILHEIEQQFYESDPAFAREVGKTTLFRHAGRNLWWAGAGFVAGFAVLVFCFASSVWLGFIGFLMMLACAFVFERNLRRVGRGWKNSWRVNKNAGASGPGIRQRAGDVGKKFKRRFRRGDEQ